MHISAGPLVGPSGCAGAAGLLSCGTCLVFCFLSLVSPVLSPFYCLLGGPRRQPTGGGPQIPGCSGPPQDSHGDATARPERPERPPRLPKEAPKRASRGQDGPRWLQDGPQSLQESSKTALEGPKTAQEAAKTPSDVPKRPPRRPPRS